MFQYVRAMIKYALKRCLSQGLVWNVKTPYIFKVIWGDRDPFPVSAFALFLWTHALSRRRRFCAWRWLLKGKAKLLSAPAVSHTFLMARRRREQVVYGVGLLLWGLRVGQLQAVARTVTVRLSPTIAVIRAGVIFSACAAILKLGHHLCGTGHFPSAIDHYRPTPGSSLHHIWSISH